MTDLDRRLNAFRTDLADQRLRGTVEAARFVAPSLATVAVDAAPLLAAPDANAGRDTELLFGETVDVFEHGNGWAWVQAKLDGYVGYLHADALSDGGAKTTHTVTALRTFVYSESNLKSPPRHLVSMNAPLAATGVSQDGFIALAGGGWVFEGHVAAEGEHASDHGTVALAFLGTPYLWGGRTSLGLDCSALVQMALMRCGKAVPRDSDMQEATLPRPDGDDRDLPALQRGDVVYWKGHCGIWIAADTFIHANATDMAVAIQPLAAILDHVGAATGDPAPRVRRP